MILFCEKEEGRKGGEGELSTAAAAASVLLPLWDLGRKGMEAEGERERDWIFVDYTAMLDGKKQEEEEEENHFYA